MAAEPKILGVHLRAIAQSTELEERVLQAVALASGTQNISVSKAEGHFGTPIMIFEAELRKRADISRFVGLMSEAGVLQALAGQAEARTDSDCTFHFRLDKQEAFLGKLALAAGKDVIDVSVKIGTYPAKPEAAARAVAEWLGSLPTQAATKH